MERLAPFSLARPSSLTEATTLLARAPSARLLAGGTDLIPNLRDGLDEPPLLVDVARLPGLEAIDVRDDGVTIGAGATLARLAAHEALAAKLPVLREAALTIAGPAHRTTATLGGNLCLDTRCVYYNQSEWWRHANAYCLKRGGDVCHVAPQGKRCHAAFSGDLAPVLLVLGATLTIAAAHGTRRRPLGDLYVDDGAHHLSLATGDIVVAVHVAAQPAGARAAYRKARVRGAIDFPLAGVAMRVQGSAAQVEALSVALTGTNSRPFVLDGTDAICGRPLTDASVAALGKLVQKQVSPMRTTVTASNYRRQVAAVLAQRLLRALATDGAR
jgi:4-hydroxybenzoyl-CoA reductase subunit beta